MQLNLISQQAFAKLNQLIALKKIKMNIRKSQSFEVVTPYIYKDGVFVRVQSTPNVCQNHDAYQKSTKKTASIFSFMNSHSLEIFGIAIGLFIGLITLLGMATNFKFIPSLGVHRIAAGSFISSVLLIAAILKVNF